MAHLPAMSGWATPWESGSKRAKTRPWMEGEGPEKQKGKDLLVKKAPGLGFSPAEADQE